MRFSANVSVLFKEAPFLERFMRTKEAGFSAVEFWWPSGEGLGELARPRGRTTASCGSRRICAAATYASKT